MKRALLFLLLSVGLINFASACEIKFQLVGDKKEAYKTGDELVVEVQVQLIHHHCPIELKQTKFTYEGMKILGATEWKEAKSGLFTRQVKIQLTDSKLNEAKLNVIRKCDKDGGYGVFTIKRI